MLRQLCSERGVKIGLVRVNGPGAVEWSEYPLKTQGGLKLSLLLHG